MNFQNINKALNDFGKYVVQQSRSRLTKGNQGGGALYDSIRYTLDEEQKGFILDFYMEDYGKFQDQGVKGANPSLIKGGKQKAPTSKFSYKQKMPPMKPLRDWAQSKNIRFRDKKVNLQKAVIRVWHLYYKEVYTHKVLNLHTFLLNHLKLHLKDYQKN